MTLEAFYTHAAGLPAVEETYPFGPQALVLKVGGKMFALISPDDLPPRANLKCDPERAIALRAEYDEVIPGYHMNKRHWNTVLLTPTLPVDVVEGWVNDSYDLVVASLTKRVRATLPPREGAGTV